MPTVRDVRSPTAGTVWTLEAAPGDQLEADDPIAILEAMKMEIPVHAPAGGRLVELLVAAGEAVSEDQVIARMELG
ncbi:biotin protein [Phenylobacterium zucineum HLK1]|uniref:Biotin protein n=1 Tax=Phenylobacterium zucineum (strain HLK1) TaxID=450851 RepID=B4RH20_PHEZH|nr:acetyl-CoA carboxylase biotin carboxyl carrier protein subunit [Phenylobacterium zucineum]ACG78968.1 biotin protein [Phenylobacterium zucineum HLK1]